MAFLASSSFLACSRKWIFMWRRRSSDLANRLPQVSQANGFSPVCVRIWVVKWSEREKFLMQIRHWNGFCPVWVRMWRVSSSDLENLLGQVSTGHAYGRSLGGVRDRPSVGLLRFAFSKLAPAFEGRPGLWTGLQGVVKKSDGVVVWRSSLSIIAAVWSVAKALGKGEGAPRIGHFMFSVAVACINIGDEELTCCCMGRWYRLPCAGSLGSPVRLLLVVTGTCSCWRSCGVGVCTLFGPELDSCDMGSLTSWKNELQGVVPAWLIKGVRTVRSGIQRLCAGEL